MSNKALKGHFGGLKRTFKRRRTQAEDRSQKSEIRGQRLGLEAGPRMRDDGLRRFYHLRETQAAYNSNFTPKNSVLSAKNTYFWNVNS